MKGEAFVVVRLSIAMITEVTDKFPPVFELLLYS